jgi:hypothetical protein
MLKQISKYEQTIIEDLQCGDELTVKLHKGMELVNKIKKDNAKGNYRLYNRVTGGIGTQSPVGNLLAKLGIE